MASLRLRAYFKYCDFLARQNQELHGTVFRRPLKEQAAGESVIWASAFQVSFLGFSSAPQQAFGWEDFVARPFTDEDTEEVLRAAAEFSLGVLTPPPISIPWCPLGSH